MSSTYKKITKFLNSLLKKKNKPYSKYIIKNTKPKKNAYLAICDKPSQIAQLIGFEKTDESINLGKDGDNLIIIALDTLGNNDSIEMLLRLELDENNLSKARIVKYERNDVVYTADYSNPNGLRDITSNIRKKIDANISLVFCALLSQQFVKIHLDAYKKSSIYLLEDGLGSYLETSVKNCTSWKGYYSHKGVVLQHLERVNKINLLHSDLGISNSYLNPQLINIDFNSLSILEEKPKFDIYTFKNDQNLHIMIELLKEYWLRQAAKLELEDGYEAVLIGQNLSDFSNNFFFRNELELYIETCERLLMKFQKIIFAPHPKAAKRIALLMKERLTSPERVLILSDNSVPVESIFMKDNKPQYAIGFYSSSMWNIKNILNNQDVYTALGWNTQKLYKELILDIQKQGYRKARQSFHSVEKLEKDLPNIQN